MGKKVFVIGYFGYVSGQLDGQTVKTRNIYELFRKYGGERYTTRYYDTQEFKKQKLSPFKIFRNAAWCDTLVLIPQDNSLKYVFPLVYSLSRIFRFSLIHIAIGSEQADFFRNKKWFRKAYVNMGKSIRGFLLEVGRVEKDLQEEFGFANTGTSRNFRVHDFVPEIANRNHGLRIVFMSRVTENKGTESVFRIGEYIRDKYPAGDITIDFYGQISGNRERFLEGVEANPLISYKGELKPEDVHETLSAYDLLLLPTRYPREGFPGAILDSYICGIPVLVSNWAYVDEFVTDGETGFVHHMDDIEAFCRSIDLFYSDKGKLLEMKRNSWEESKKYSEEGAWKEIEKFL